MSRTLFILALAGCPAVTPDDTGATDTGGLGDMVERARIEACIEGPDVYDETDLDLDLEGTVVDTAGCGDAAWAVSVQTDAGDVYTVGLSVVDGAADLTPALPAVVEGEAVSLVVRRRLVWGTVAGFVLTDSAGLAVAVEQGGWGGALEEHDVPGLTVALGELVAIEETGCQPVEGHAIDFQGDALVSVVPIDGETVALGGADYTAMAVAAYEYGESPTCSVSDTTDVTAWVLYR